MPSSTQKLKTLLAQDRTDLALKQIIAAVQYLTDQQLYNQAIVLSNRWNANERNLHLGTHSENDYVLEKNKINQAILVLIDKLSASEEEDSMLVDLKKRRLTCSVTIAFAATLIAVLAGLAEFTGYSLRDFFSFGRDDSMQLTVYVQGTDGRPIPELQNKGKVIVDFGNDRRAPLIGENGRCNFGEIPEKFRDKAISIVLEAEGYEAIEPNKKYVLDGKPVYFLVRRNNSLGIIHGRVTTRDGNRFIERALVIVSAEGQDTTTLTDSAGYFRVVLPENMQQEEYLLTVSKTGFQITRDRFRPKTTPADIRLEK